jgi:hypothetical protein
MSGRWIARPSFAQLCAVAMVACVPLAAASAVAASTFGAGTGVGLAARTATAGVYRHAKPIRWVTLQTLVANVSAHSGPGPNYRVTGRIKRRGTNVRIACYAYGRSVAGNPVWYRLSGPVRGYVTSYFVDSHVDPAAGVQSCSSRPFSRTYRTIVKGVHIRYWPTAGSTRLMTLGRAGARVAVNCYTFGQSAGGDRVWYHVIEPMNGFVAGSHLNTGRDPARGIPACW